MSLELSGFDPKMKAVRAANLVTAQELLSLIPHVIVGSTQRTSPSNLRWVLNRVIEEIDTFPLDKMGRWIGFVQGVLALSNHLDVDEERDRTRERYHAAYIATGQVVPKTMEHNE